MAEKKALPEELNPAHYIERVSLVSGEVLEEPILPRQLLVQAHRDYHVVDIHARHMMSRMMRATDDPEATRSQALLMPPQPASTVRSVSLIPHSPRFRMPRATRE